MSVRLGLLRKVSLQFLDVLHLKGWLRCNVCTFGTPEEGFVAISTRLAFERMASLQCLDAGTNQSQVMHTNIVTQPSTSLQNGCARLHLEGPLYIPSLELT